MVTQFGFLLLARAIFRETSSKIDIKPVNVIMYNTNRQQFFMGCTPIDQRNMVDKSTDHEILLSIRYDQYLPGSLLELFKISHEYHRE